MNVKIVKNGSSVVIFEMNRSILVKSEKLLGGVTGDVLTGFWQIK